jgi:NAD-dependent DNA ligase
MFYTRGNGTFGQTITHMLPYIQIGDLPGHDSYAVRGELIVSKANYDKVKEGKRGARQMVSGLANQKTITPERQALLGLIEFVAYEVIVPENLNPSEQFTLLDTHSTFHVARWATEDAVTIESLSTILTKRKETSAYEIDGIIVAHDKLYPRYVGKNPDHAFAFKMSFAEQMAVTEVLKVNWEASKDGYLKPTVNFEPINIGGAVIQYASGFNAKFIHDNGIGPGAFIEVTRSGDVIPYIREIKSISPTGPQMPEEAWHWNETHIDAILDRISGNPDVQKRVLVYFANTLDIGSCGEGTINKLHDAGIKTIPQLLQLTEAFLIDNKVSGIGKASAKKLVTNIQDAAKKATISQWAVGPGIFGRGIGTKRLDSAFSVVGSDLKPSDDLVVKVADLPSWSKDSAANFVRNLPEFKKFLDTVGVVSVRNAAENKNTVAPVSDKFKDLVVLFTGFRSKELEDAIVGGGGIISDTFSKKVNLLLIKDNTVNNEKVRKARENGINVLSVEEFAKKI